MGEFGDRHDVPGGLQLIGIGIVGEYLGRVFEQSKGRPAYLIRESSRRTDDASGRRTGPAQVRRSDRNRSGEADQHSPASRLF
jgi:polyisoprenyl-phosphate glycosyltransferase